MSTKKEKNFRSSTLLAMLVLGSIALSHPDAWAGGTCKTTAPGWVGCTSPAQATATCICKQNSSAIANYQGNQGPDGFPDIYMCQGTYTGPKPSCATSGSSSSSSTSSSSNGNGSGSSTQNQNLLGGSGSGSASGDESTSAQNNIPVDPGLNTPSKIDPGPAPAPLTQAQMNAMGGNTNPLNGLPSAPLPNVGVAPTGQTTTSNGGTPLMLDNPPGAFGSQYAAPGSACGTPPNLPCAPSTTTGGGAVATGQTTAAANQGGVQDDPQQLAQQLQQLAGPEVGPNADGTFGNGKTSQQAGGQAPGGTANQGAIQDDPQQLAADLKQLAGPEVGPNADGTFGGSSKNSQTSQAGTPAAGTTSDPGTLTPIGDGTNTSTNDGGKNGKNGNGNGNSNDPNFQVDSDCKNSANFNGKYSCKGTKTLMATTQIMVAGGQMAGSATLNTMGQTAQQNLMVNGASQSSIYQSSIDMAKDAAKAQITLGTAQLAMGYLEHKASATATKNQNDLATIKYTANTVAGGTGAAAQTAITASGNQTEAGAGFSHLYQNQALGQATSAVNAKQSAAEANTANSYRNVATNEQGSIATAAGASALKDMITGGQALLSGAFAWRNANAEQNLLNKLNNLPVATAPSADPFNTLSSTGSGTTITGDGTSGASGASAAASPLPVPSAPLGNALGNAPDNTIAAAPVAPEAGAPTGSTDIPSSGGMGGGAIGTSAAPAGSDADPQAKYADNGKGVAAYESAGFAPGGGGAKGGSGNGDAINPKDLLAAMMDQMNGKKDEPQGQDILAYGRSPASDAPFAPLPKEENFFNYIHNAYQGLQRKSRVGLN